MSDNGNTSDWTSCRALPWPTSQACCCLLFFSTFWPFTVCSLLAEQLFDARHSCSLPAEVFFFFLAKSLCQNFLGSSKKRCWGKSCLYQAETSSGTKLGVDGCLLPTPGRSRGKMVGQRNGGDKETEWIERTLRRISRFWIRGLWGGCRRSSSLLQNRSENVEHQSSGGEGRLVAWSAHTLAASLTRPSGACELERLVQVVLRLILSPSRDMPMMLDIGVRK